MADKVAVLARLALTVAQADAGQPLVQRLSLASVDLLHVDGVALTLGTSPTERITVCTIGSFSARLDDLQEVLGEGPTRDAYYQGQSVQGALPDDPDGRWPLLAEAFRRQFEPHVILALPMSPGAEPLGVMTVHRRLEPFSSETCAVAQFVADAVGAAVARDPSLGDDTDGPWASRAIVHQATGMIVSRLQLNPEDSLALIRAHAFAHSDTLTGVFRRIIGRELNLVDPDALDGKS